jgi:hypothetical protein
MTAVDHQLVKRFRQDAGDRIAEQRRLDQANGVTPMSTEDERQYARAVIAQILEEYARSEINAGRTPLDAETEEQYAAAVHAALFGVGRLQPLLDNPEVENIDINGCDQVFVGYSDGREERGEPVDARLRERLQTMRVSHVEFARVLTPDPGNAKRIAVTIGELDQSPPTFPGGRVVCTWLISHDGGAGGGCGSLTQMFSHAPFTFGYSVSGAGDQYATFDGLASDDVARLVIFPARGGNIDVPLRDNVFLAEVALARLPVKMVAYDAQGRVIGIERTPRDEEAQRPLPGDILTLRATAEGVGTLELRVNRTREGGECWAVRGSGGVAVNAGACIGRTWSFAPLRLGTVPEPPVFVYGRVRSDVRRLTLRYADGTSDDLVPGARGYVLSVVPEKQRREGHELVAIVGRGAEGQVIDELRFTQR